jgi:hypothetical protein
MLMGGLWEWISRHIYVRERMTAHLHETYPRPSPSNNPSLRRMDCMVPRAPVLGSVEMPRQRDGNRSFLVDTFFEYNERHVLGRLYDFSQQMGCWGIGIEGIARTLCDEAWT